ncbi:efflux RND transporter periplasmic adaptor subunit [Bradyrhizobium sp. AZCC 2289]|uniref:efflux RND transporter periplasmic adaptor subunit n=1 Tax=Bradyrhizobium sp. AZCC 2289 TaxID=3117026 RepID=UPI002FF1FF37
MNIILRAFSGIGRSALVLTGAFAVVGAIFLFPHWSSANAPAYKLATLDRGPIVSTVTATGTINPITTVIVGSQLSGQLVEILADYNDKVTAGQILARLNSDQIRFKRDAAKADLEQARAAQAMQEAKVAEADLNLARQVRLKPTGAVSDVSYESARTAAVVAKAQLQVDAAKILQVEAVLRQVEVDLANTDIRSPVAGVIIQRSVELGSTVAASLQSPTIFTIADDLRRMEIAVSIDETDVGRVKPGQRAVFTVSAYPGREFEGKVKHVRLGSQTVSNVVTYTGIVSIENPMMELLPGMTASVKIETESRSNALLAPNAALRWKPAGAVVKGPGVWVLGADGDPRMVPVRLGVGDGSVTEITAVEPVREVIVGKKQ